MRSVRVAGLAVLATIGWTMQASALAQDAAPASGNAERGAALAYTCLGCHGIPNYKNVAPVYRVPKLAGQHPEYLAIALAAYKNGERAHATMHAHASSMSDQDMADIAAYLAGTPIQPDASRKPIGVAPQAAQVCVACHGNDGIGIVPQYPNLVGQHADYIERALHDYKRGGRKNAVMTGFASTLSDQDIAQLAAYYSSQQPGLGIPYKRISRFSAR
jgi:cytochrome c553